MGDNKVSVIIPVYNTEKFLAKCIDSVLSQTFKEIEIVIVDDGTPDNAGVIADDYASKHSNIKVIHKKNAGLAEARKTGIKEATCKYFMHLDSDDTLPEDSVKALYDEIVEKDVDIIYGNLNRVYEDVCTSVISHRRSGILDKDKFVEYLLEVDCPCCSCGYISKRELWNDNIFPEEKLVLPSEDVFLNIRMSEYVGKVGFINKSVYNYYYNPNSLSVTGRLNNQELWKRYFILLKENLKSRGILEKFEKQIYIYEVDRIAFYISNADYSDSWIQEVLKANYSELPLKTKCLRLLLPHPILLKGAIKANRTIKRVTSKN